MSILLPLSYFDAWCIRDRRVALAARLALPSAASLALLITVAAPRCASAQVVTAYNDLTAYNVAATTTATYGFEGIAASMNYALNPSVSPLTVTVTGGGNGTNYFVEDAMGNNFSLNGSADLLGTNTAASAANTTTIGFGSSLTAFGTEFGFRSGSVAPFSTGTVSVQLFNGTAAVGTAFSSAVPDTETFIGLTSTQAFDRATFTTTALASNSGTAYQTFDNVRVGSAITGAAAPEPGSIALLALAGAPVIGMIARRRRHA